jgi:hypothetical protein
MSALHMTFVDPNRGSMTFDLVIADEPDGANLGESLDCDAWLVKLLCMKYLWNHDLLSYCRTVMYAVEVVELCC